MDSLEIWSFSLLLAANASRREWCGGEDGAKSVPRKRERKGSEQERRGAERGQLVDVQITTYIAPAEPVGGRRRRREVRRVPERHCAAERMRIDGLKNEDDEKKGGERRGKKVMVGGRDGERSRWSRRRR